jgi:hypothetical protein
MLQRIADVVRVAAGTEGGRASLESLLSEFERGAELLEIDALLEGCLVQKDGARLFSRA